LANLILVSVRQVARCGTHLWSNRLRSEGLLPQAAAFVCKGGNRRTSAESDLWRHWQIYGQI